MRFATCVPPERRVGAPQSRIRAFICFPHRGGIHAYLETGDKRVMIGLFGDGQKTEALSFAAKAAAFLSIPVRDRLVEKGDINPAGVVVETLDPEDAD